MFGLFGLEVLEADLMLGAMTRRVGMPMTGIGYCAPGCMRSCCRTVVICQPGCIGPCCANRPRMLCAPGCTLPCCQSINMGMNINPVSRYAPMGQNAYFPNRLLPQQQVSYRQNPGMVFNGNVGMAAQGNMGMTPMGNRGVIGNGNIGMRGDMGTIPSQNAGMVSNGTTPEISDIERTKRQQINLQYRQQVQIQDQKTVGKQEAKIGMQGNYNSQGLTNGTVPTRQNYQQYTGNNGPQVKQQVVFQGEVYEKIGSQWQCLSATLTLQSFMRIPLQAIDKLKIKAQSQMKGTRLIKISLGMQQYFYSIPTQQQLPWMLNLFYAKLLSMGYAPKPLQQSNASVEGQIIKKTFLGGWENKFGAVTSQAFKISNGIGSSPEKTISGVREIWSRFETVKGSMVVIKMHWQGSKVEVGVPIGEVLIWLHGLYNLIR